MPKAVFGIVPDRARADALVARLIERGIAHDEISVLFADREQTIEFANRHDTAREGAFTGASTGTVVGSVLGTLAYVGSLVVPGLGIFLIAGPLMILFGAVAGGLLGSIAGALKGLGLPASHAHFYEERVKAGEVLMSVHPKRLSDVTLVKDTMQEMGAHEIFATVEELDVHSRPL